MTPFTPAATPVSSSKNVTFVDQTPVVLRDEFFDNIENFRPLRGGRRAQTLNNVASGSAKVSVGRAEDEFLKTWTAAKAPNCSDPLEKMWLYTNWFEEHFPSGKQRYFYPILYKICTEFSAQERYRNDERLMKIWFKLTENFPESGLAVMELAFHRGSCRQLSRFYSRWAEMYQFMGWWNRAREKLQLGLEMRAAPIQIIHNAMYELEAAIMRTIQEESQEEEEVFDGQNSREMLAKLRGLGQKHYAPIIRIPCGPPGKVDMTPFGRKPKAEAFKLFVDDESTSNYYQRTSVFIGDKKSPKTSIIAHEFKDDPEYQALFGHFQAPMKFDLDYTNKENEICLPMPVLETPQRSQESTNHLSFPVPAFKVFVDDENNESVKEEKSSSRKRKHRENEGQKLRLRLALKKCLVKQMSIEEHYSMLIEKNRS